MMLALYCALVFIASLAGGWLLLAMRLTHTRLQMAVSFVSGLMLAMALLHFIPHSYHQGHDLERTMLWVLVGFLMMFFLQRFLPHHHHDVQESSLEHVHDGDCSCKHHEPPPQVKSGAAGGTTSISWVATTLGMTLHSLVGGVALAAAVTAQAGGDAGLVGLGTALVIILHKPFDAMTVSTMMTAGGCSKNVRHLLNFLFAFVTPLGALLFYAGASHWFGASPAFLGSALAFCAGTFLCIACADLLPELQFHSHDRLKLSLALAAGLGVALLIGEIESSGHDHGGKTGAAEAGHVGH